MKSIYASIIHPPSKIPKTRWAINFILLLGDCNAPHGVY